MYKCQMLAKWLFLLSNKTFLFHQSKLTLQQEIRYVFVDAVLRTVTQRGSRYIRIVKFMKSRTVATAIAD